MRAILFDVSGTILDTKEHIFWQFEELTKAFDGAAASRQEIASAMHGTVDDVIHSLVKSQEHPFHAIKARHDELYEQSLHQMQLYPHVDELLPILQRMGFRLAAVTSGDHRITDALDYTGIRHYFDIVVTDDHVLRPKPHPEGIRYALTHMGIDPQQAIVIGDTGADILAGQAAGVSKTVAMLHGFGDAASLRATQPDHLIEDIPSILDVVE